MKCPLCHSEQLALGKFCDVCGAPLTIVHCPACNEASRLNARFCASCGNPLIADSAQPVDNSWTLGSHQAEPAERRLLTVLFCDLVGSTALSVDLDPEDLREVIGTYRRSLGAYCRGASRRERLADSRRSGQQYLLLD
jgi:hypothetical protein